MRIEENEMIEILLLSCIKMVSYIKDEIFEKKLIGKLCIQVLEEESSNKK